MLTHVFSHQAELALASDETPVGCVFVHDGKVIAQGMNGTNVTMNVSKQIENETPAITLSACSGYMHSINITYKYHPFHAYII